MKRLLAWLALAIGLVAGGLWLFRAPLALSAYAAGASRVMADDAMDRLPDGLHAAFCGTGSPMPDPDRAGPCLAIIAGDRLFVVDAGEGAARNLALMRLSAGRIDRVLLTHFHSDHIDGLGALMLQRWVAAAAARGSGAATAPLPLVGPAGVEDIAAGFNAAYARDSGYRVAHHGADVVPPEGFGLMPMAFADGDAGVLEEGGLTIRAFVVDHSPVAPAVGYRFDYKGRCIAISGDTVAMAALVQAAKGCDLLVHEALQPRLTRILGDAAQAAGNAGLQKIMTDIEDYHTTPEQAADVAQQAGVTMLALTHVVPPLRFRALEGPFLGDARQRFDGRLVIARDRDIISLPADGGIETARLGERFG